MTTSDGLVFQTNAETIIDVQSLIASLPDGAVFEGYKNADDTYNDITKAQFETALAEGMQRKIAAFAKRKVLSELVVAAKTKIEIDAITW